MTAKRNDLWRYRCPHCDGTRAYNGDPTTGARYRGSARCLDCGKSFSVVGRDNPNKPLDTGGGYRCSGYRLSAGSTVLDVYLTRKIPADVSAFTDFLEWSGASQAMGGLVAALRALPGFPLEMRSHVNVMGEMHETLSTIAGVKVGPHAAALFAPPAGWKVEAESSWEE